jgi:Domain of unknown function (DUF3291)
MVWQLAQINIGRLRAPIDDPLIVEFRDALEEINALAERSPGFVWRLQTNEGNATALHPTDDELVIPNMSVWESTESLADFVFRSDHLAFLRRRREWFDRYDSAYVALWWVAAGDIPTLEEGMKRLSILERDGPTRAAFTFTRRFAPPGVDTEPAVDLRDVCPV